MNTQSDAISAARPWKQLVLACLVLAVIVAFFWLLWAIKGVLLPLFFAFFLAYLLNPLVDKLQKFRVARPIAAALAVLFMLLLLSLMVFLPWPIVSTELQLLQAKMPQFIVWAQGVVERSTWLNQYLPHGMTIDNVDWLKELQAYVSESVNVTSVGQQAWAYFKQGSSAIISTLSWSVLMPILSFFLLLDWHGRVANLKTLVPVRWQDEVIAIITGVDEALEHYIRGQFLVMICLAAYYAIALKIVGLQVAISVGVLTGLFVIIPFVGFGLGLLLAVVSALLQFGVAGPFWAVLAVYGAGQLLEGYVLTPRLIGERIGMSTVGVIVAMMIFSTLFGFIGLMMALPASAVLVVISRMVRQTYLHSRFYAHDV